MKAVRLVEVGKPLLLEEVPMPQVGEDNVLVEVRAAGICHSDAHYRSGRSPVSPLPLVLGHEVAGIVVQFGLNVHRFTEGDRVCLHYMVTCGECEYCKRGIDQFCIRGKMIGKYRDGGYAEYISVPARSVIKLPPEISFEHGAVMMCSSATSLHALKKARIKRGDSVAVFGVGGLGFSAVQLALAFGASKVYAVDIQPSKLEIAEHFGAVSIDASRVDPVEALLDLTQGGGVDIALELIGLPLVMDQALRCLGIHGRLAIAGLSDRNFEFTPYKYLINREAEIIGVSDHLLSEIPELISLVLNGKLDLSGVVTRKIPLDAESINVSLDRLDSFSNDIRVVIEPS